MLWWTLGYTCLFPFWFPQCVCPAVGLLDHKAVLHCWWECKLVQPLWRTVWRFLKKLEIEPQKLLYASLLLSWVSCSKGFWLFLLFLISRPVLSFWGFQFYDWVSSSWQLEAVCNGPKCMLDSRPHTSGVCAWLVGLGQADSWTQSLVFPRKEKEF